VFVCMVRLVYRDQTVLGQNLEKYEYSKKKKTLGKSLDLNDDFVISRFDMSKKSKIMINNNNI